MRPFFYLHNYMDLISGSCTSLLNSQILYNRRDPHAAGDAQRDDAEFVDAGDRLGSESFVQFDDVDIFNLQVYLLQCFERRVDRTHAHQFRGAADCRCSNKRPNRSARHLPQPIAHLLNNEKPGHSIWPGFLCGEGITCCKEYLLAANLWLLAVNGTLLTASP